MRSLLYTDYGSNNEDLFCDLAVVLPVYSNLLEVCFEDLKVDANSANFNLRCNDSSLKDLIEYLEGVSVYYALTVATY